DPRVQPRELDAQPRGLHLVEATTVAELDVLIAAGVAVMTQPTHALGDIVARGEHHAGITAGAKVLRRIKGQARRVAPAAERETGPRRPHRLRVVLEQRNVAR